METPARPTVATKELGAILHPPPTTPRARTATPVHSRMCASTRSANPAARRTATTTTSARAMHATHPMESVFMR